MVDLFTLNFGRLTVIARGAQRGAHSWQSLLQPFIPVQVAWRGRGNLPTLTSVDPGERLPVLMGATLYCGFYVNELVQRLLPEWDPSEPLFSAYLETMQSLAQQQSPEPILRRFEWALVVELGHGFDWAHTGDSGAPIVPDGTYGFAPGVGFLALPESRAALSGLDGDRILAAGRGALDQPGARRVAKAVMRVMIDNLLRGRPLHSRRLFQP